MARSKKSAQQPMRLAFVGSGGIAGMHIAALHNFPAKAQIVALADPSDKAMNARIEEHQLEGVACYTDYKKMLREVKPDIVNICTPNGLHAPASIAASKAGAHVVVEKPMAMNVKEAKAMIAAAKQARKKLVVGFQYRYDPKTQLIRRAFDEGTLGNVLFGRVQALRRRGIPNWGVFGRKDLQGGGPMIDIGVHALEMCHYAMGSPKPVAACGQTFTYLGNKPSNKIASAWAGWDYKNYTVEDLAVGHIRFENGAVVHIESSFAAHMPQDHHMDFQLMGDKGGATWTDGKIYTDQLGHMVNIEPAWLGATDFNAHFKSKTEMYLDHFRGDGPNQSPGEHGLMIQQMLDGIYTSADRGGKEVTIK